MLRTITAKTTTGSSASTTTTVATATSTTPIAFATTALMPATKTMRSTTSTTTVISSLITTSLFHLNVSRGCCRADGSQESNVMNCAGTLVNSLAIAPSKSK